MEMKNKLQQLHRLMTREGLGESAEVVEKLLEANEKDRRRGEQISEEPGMNRNENAIVNNSKPLNKQRGDLRHLKQSQSVETIYESAVPQRNSSSSEEDFLLEANQVQGDRNLITKRIDNLILDA